MDRIDEQLKKIFSQEIEVSSRLEETIIKSVYSQKNNYKRLFRYKKLQFAISFCCFILLMSGIVFAENINIFLKNIFGLHDGINSAIENGYIEKGNADFINSSDVKAKLEYVLFDDYNLCISMLFEFPESLRNIEKPKVFLPNFIMYDENENLLFCRIQEEIDTSFFDLQNLENSEYGYDWDSEIKGENSVLLTYRIETDTLPKSKKIFVKFDKVQLLDYTRLDMSKGWFENIEDMTVKKSFGEWKLEMDLSEKSYNRENIVYKIKNLEEFGFEVISDVTTTQTETRFKMHHIFESEENFVNINLDEEPYIENERGQKFGLKYSNVSLIKNKMEYEYNFTMSAFDVTDTLKMVFTLENGHDMILELERKE